MNFLCGIAKRTKSKTKEKNSKLQTKEISNDVKLKYNFNFSFKYRNDVSKHNPLLNQQLKVNQKLLNFEMDLEKSIFVSQDSPSVDASNDLSQYIGNYLKNIENERRSESSDDQYWSRLKADRAEKLRQPKGRNFWWPKGRWLYLFLSFKSC